MRPTLRAAGDSDWRIYFAADAPRHWAGLVAEDATMTIGIGGMFSDDGGKWWAFLAQAPGICKPIMMMRAAKCIVEAAQEADVVLHAVADPAMTGSDALLRRLGFIETAEKFKGEHPIWTL